MFLRLGGAIFGLMVAWTTLVHAAEGHWQPTVAKIAWLEYQKLVNHVHGECSSEDVEYDSQWNIVKTTPSQRSVIDWIGDNIRVENHVLEANGKIGGFLQNRAYSAHAYRDKDDPKSWRISEILPHATPLLTGPPLSPTHPANFVKNTVLCGVHLNPIRVFDIMLDPKLVVTETTEDQIDGVSVVWVTFKRSAKGKDGDVTESGRIAFLPSHYWLIRKASLRNIYRWEGGHQVENADFDIEYDIDSTTSIPLPKSYVVRGKTVDSHSLQKPFFGGIIVKSHFELIDPSSMTEEEFRLTQYGLPEPVPTESRQAKWWLVVLCSGVFLIGAWRYLSNRDRQSGR